jgi:hypothetical protein
MGVSVDVEAMNSPARSELIEPMFVTPPAKVDASSRMP